MNRCTTTLPTAPHATCVDAWHPGRFLSDLKRQRLLGENARHSLYRASFARVLSQAFSGTARIPSSASAGAEPRLWNSVPQNLPVRCRGLWPHAPRTTRHMRPPQSCRNLKRSRLAPCTPSIGPLLLQITGATLHVACITRVTAILSSYFTS